jgi:tetratricopeptide (TPR) repeat protein
MFKNRSAVLLGWLVFVTASEGSGQTPAPPASQPTAAPGSIKLTGADAKRADELDEAIDAALKADRWDEAIAKAEEKLALRTEVQGLKHFETVSMEWHLKTLRRVAPMPKEDRVAYQSANTLNQQGDALDAQGKYAQAQPLYEKALEIRRRLLTDEHPLTAMSYNNLAQNLDAQGKYAQAQPLHEKALGIRRRLLTDDHLDTAGSYNNLAYNLYAQGKYTAAEPLYEKALEIRRRLLSDEHLHTAESYNNLAAFLGAQGKHAAAQPLFEKALGIRRRLLTDDHPLSAMAYNNLGYNLNAQGKYAAAQPLVEKALEIQRRMLTDDHPDTASSYNNVAANLRAQGKYAAAQPLFEKALEIRRRLLTDDHPNTAQSYNSVAYNLNAQGKYAAAQPLFEKALEIHRRLLTDNHPDTATSYSSLAYNLNAQGKYAPAQPLFEKALEIRRRLLTDDHPHTATSYNDVAFNLYSQGKYAAAQPLFEKALEINRRRLTDDHPSTANGYNNLAVNLAAQGKHAAAQPLYEKALEIKRRLVTGDHPDIAVQYGNLANNLNAQGKYAAAQPLYERALEIFHRRLTDDHPFTAKAYNSVAGNLALQGKYTAAQPLYEKALSILRRLLTDDHPRTAASYNDLAANLYAQGRYAEARNGWISAVKGLDAARLSVAFTGLERARIEQPVRPALAAVQARLGQPIDAWQQLEQDLGRGLLDELAARRDQRLAPGDRTRLRELLAQLERLDKLVETTPQGLDQAGRAKRFEDLKRQRDLASIALGEFQTKLVDEHGALAGQAAKLNEIQAALPADCALVAWVDIPVGPSTADPDGEHWGVVVRSRGIPAWVPMAGTGPGGLWTEDDTKLAERVRTELRRRPGAGSADLRPLVEKLRTQRLEQLAKALGASADGLPPARRLIVLPSRAMARIPVEALLGDDPTPRNGQAPSATIRTRRASEGATTLTRSRRAGKGATTEQPTWTVSYAPSATVLKYLREQPRPDRHAGFLALGDPIFEQSDRSSLPGPLPDHGLLVNMVAPGSNAATHGLKLGDVLLAYNGTVLRKREDLRAVPEPGQPVPVEVWRAGEVAKRELAPGKLGVVLDTRPAAVAIAAQRKLQQVLVAARSGGEDDFAPLPGTRYEVEALARLFKSDDRPTRILLGTDANELDLDRLAGSGELGHYGFIHLATHGVIDEDLPTRSAVILTQTGLPDPLQQALSNKPVFDGRLTVREIQHDWELKAELVTLSACETALGREAGGEGFVGFTQALLMSGARSLCLSLWKVDDTATALLMQRFYANLLGRRPGLSGPMPKAEALREAKTWLRELRRPQVLAAAADLSAGVERGKGASARQSSDRGETRPLLVQSQGGADDRPYAAPYFWAAFVLVGDPD